MIYENEYLREISFPLGGIGTGCVGIAGNGMLVDWEILNRPNKGSINGATFFAVCAEYPDGRRIVKMLHGDFLKNLSGPLGRTRGGGFGHGAESNTMCGFPHFEKVVFDGRFPTATLTFSDKNFPGTPVLTAWSPFIPLDSENSSIPAACFDFRIDGADEGAEYSFVFAMRNPFIKTKNEDVSKDGFAAVRMYCPDTEKTSVDYGDATVITDGDGATVQKYWYRGAWREPMTIFWRELTTGKFADRDYADAVGNDTCTLIKKTKDGRARFVLTWNAPNRCNYWDPLKDENGNDVTWKNYYATRFESSTDSALYIFTHYDELLSKTVAFRDALHSSTLDPAVIDAASSALSVLRSPTVMRLENGALYGFEGVNERTGSCEGTCTHVWSYAYALCFLFPDLERSIRETEFKYDTAECGRMRFRTLLPLGRTAENRPQCLDGQVLSVVKSYREWKISGDDGWLKANWETIKKVLSYVWSDENYQNWDRDHDGVLEGRQHNTLDTDEFGPTAWLEGLYLTALRAGAEMAEYLGENDLRDEYLALFDGGYKFTKEQLFNGEYFIQKIDVKDKNLIKIHDCESYYNAETGEIVNQIAGGCEIDQMLGQWHANILGLGEIFDPEQRKTALGSMMKYNFKPSLREFANLWRVFALGDEAGAIICDYPAGCERPAIPIPYADECMTGFEYAFAGLLIGEGFVSDGLKVVRAIRARYDGKKRNPYNEIECGSNYARSMASFALLPIFSGFSFDLPRKKIGFDPIPVGDFKCLFSLGTGWGTFERVGGVCEIKLLGGHLELSSISLGGAEKIKTVKIDGAPTDFEQSGDELRFALSRIEKSAVFGA